MTREEEINKEAHRVSYNGDEFSSFIQAAEWADKTMIDKACKWLDCYLERTIQRPSQIELQTSDAIDIIEVRRHEVIRMLLADFKKAMEE